MSESNTRAETKRSRCAECGAWGPENEYHPYAYCVLVKAIGEEAARANIDAVVEYGRKSALTALEASGMAVVPREATEAMLDNGGSSIIRPSIYMGGTPPGAKRRARDVWAAMLAAHTREKDNG